MSGGISTRINNIYFPHAETSVTRGEGEGRGKEQKGNERDVSGRCVLNLGRHAFMKVHSWDTINAFLLGFFYIYY